MASKPSREVAVLPARAAPSLKLPILPPFESAESIVQALSSYETAVLTAALLQVEKRALALVALPAPRAIPDPLLDYITKYPTVDGVFSAWDAAHKTNNSQLSAAVLQALGALVRLISSDAGASEPEVIRRLLTQYGTHLDRALNPGRNDVTVAALKLLNVVIGFGSGRFARRMFGAMQWQPKIVTRLYRTRLRDTSRDPLARPDIRTLLTMLILALLSSGDSRLKADVIDTKGLISGLVKGLAEDPEIVVNHVLVALFTDVAQDRTVSLETRRSVFDEQCITELIKLYDVASDDAEEDARIHASIHRFLFALTEWLASQIHDTGTRSFGTQRVLGTILRLLKVTEDSQQRELGLHILTRAPMLAGAFWARFPASLDPRLSSRWISAVTFATQVVSLPVSTFLTADLTSLAAPPSVVSIMDNVLPPSLNKTWYSKALQHESPLVSFLASIFLLASLQKAAQILAAIASSSKRLEEVASVGRWANLGVRLREHLRTVLPDPQIVVALMQKTAVTVPALPKPSKSKKVVDPKKAEAKAKAALLEAEAGEAAGRHLRTNVALRLLWVYHRVVPSLISTLRFDFARLPQAHVVRNDAEGIRAISSAYSLRLAAIHSSTLIWSRPGDHFKNTLHPLFQLYRTPATPSNRHLLLSILGRLLTTPLLFGQASDEVEIWLRTLPVPSKLASVNDGTSRVLDFFEKAVHKTLTAPIRTAVTETDAVPSTIAFSPLLSNVLIAIKAELKVDGADLAPMMTFVRELVYGFMGQAATIELPRALVGDLQQTLTGVEGDIAQTTRELLADCLFALEKSSSGQAFGGDQAMDGGESGDRSTRSPVTANVFVSETEPAALALSLALMPAELSFLHVRPVDLVTPSILSVLLQLVAAKDTWLSTSQILLHRYINGEWSDVDRAAFAGFFKAIVDSCGDRQVQQQIKTLLFGASGLSKTFAAGTSDTPFASIAGLVASVLSPSEATDVLLALPYCAVIAEDVKSVKTKKSKKAAAIPQRVAESSALLPFFDDDATLLFLDTLLSRVPLSTISELALSTKAIIESTLARAAALPTSASLHSLWTAHFVALHRLSTEAGLVSAGVVLARGAEALLPFSLSTTARNVKSASAPSLGSDWQEHALEWATEILSEDQVGLEQAQVLATLIYRSGGSRQAFAAWLAARDASNVEGAEAAVRALLEVETVKSSGLDLPLGIALSFADRLLHAATEAVSEADMRRALVLMCQLSSGTATAVREYFAVQIPTLERDAYTPSMLAVLSDLVGAAAEFRESLDAYVNGSFTWLVRRFAEDEEDTEAVLLFVHQLSAVCQKHTGWAHKTHLLDPVITAAISKRLDQPEPIALAAALCAGHAWKDNEVTRLLNNIFASEHFKARTLSDEKARKVQSTIVRLAVSIARSSVSAAATSRAVEKLMPLYGGTLSTDDRLLLDLFQRIELTVGHPLSVAFRKWNPSLDQSPPESTRAGTLAALQVGYVRRSWLRVCASTRTTFPVEHANITYDPEFLLPFLSHAIVEEELKASDWLGFLETGVLGLAVAALASSSPSLCRLAQSTLADSLVKIETLTFREKDEIALIFAHARNCVYSSAGEPIPSIIALFLAHCVYMLSTPESTLYPAFSRFLLQRPLLDQRDVPMFYTLFYTTSEEPLEDQRWLLRFLADGLVRSQDWKIFRRRQTYELLASLLQSSRHDPATRKLVLQFLIRATSIPQAARELLSRNGLLGWISTQAPVDAAERRMMISVISNIVDVLGHDKLAPVADALDALLGSCSASEVLPSEVASICQIAAKLTHSLASSPIPDTSATLPLLIRATNLLSFVAPRLPTNAASQGAFYMAVMATAYARDAAGAVETGGDRELFSAAIRAGLGAGIDEVRVQILRSLAA